MADQDRNASEQFYVLNRQFMTYLQYCYDSNKNADFTPVLEDYIKYSNEIWSKKETPRMTTSVVSSQLQKKISPTTSFPSIALKTTFPTSKNETIQLPVLSQLLTTTSQQNNTTTQPFSLFSIPPLTTVPTTRSSPNLLPTLVTTTSSIQQNNTTTQSFPLFSTPPLTTVPTTRSSPLLLPTLVTTTSSSQQNNTTAQQFSLFSIPPLTTVPTTRSTPLLLPTLVTTTSSSHPIFTSSELVLGKVSESMPPLSLSIPPFKLPSSFMNPSSDSNFSTSITSVPNSMATIVGSMSSPKVSAGFDIFGGASKPMWANPFAPSMSKSEGLTNFLGILPPISPSLTSLPTFAGFAEPKSGFTLEPQDDDEPDDEAVPEASDCGYEPGALCSVRAKLFYLHEGKYREMGVGIFNVKPIESDPQQMHLVFRIESSQVGSLLMNIRVHKNSKNIQKQNETNLLIISVANPPLHVVTGDKSLEGQVSTVSYLVRTKTSSDMKLVLGLLND